MQFPALHLMNNHLCCDQLLLIVVCCILLRSISHFPFLMDWTNALLVLASRIPLASDCLSHCPLCWGLAQLSVQLGFTACHLARPVTHSCTRPHSHTPTHTFTLLVQLCSCTPLNTWLFRAKWNVSMSWFMYFTMRSSATPPLRHLLLPSSTCQAPVVHWILFNFFSFRCSNWRCLALSSQFSFLASRFSAWVLLRCCSCSPFYFTAPCSRLSHIVWADLNVS